MTVLLAISGGIDSIYMGERASELFPGASFAVAHCNFSLRGKESDGDEDFVREWCSSRHLPLHVRKFDTAVYAREHGLSTEMAARELRYRWFADLCRIGGYVGVAVAHNADDNAETLLLNMLRGCGTRGMRGMAAESVNEGVKVLRPLLGVSRAEIRSWMESRRLEWREDSSNAGDTYKRNLLRHKVLPVFREINPAFLETLASDMRHIAQADDITRDFVEQWRPVVTLPDGSIDVPALLGAPHWRFLLYALTAGTINADTLERLCEWALSPVSGKRFGPWVTTADRIIPQSEARPRGWEVEVFDRPADMPLKQPRGTLVMDADAVGEAPVIRPWREGDWMVPLGMRGRKKLSDLFTDLHYSLADKAAAQVVEMPSAGRTAGRGSRVAALLGERIDDSVKVTPSTRRVLRISAPKSQD